MTSVGFQSDATGWGSIAIGSNATAENSKMPKTAANMTEETANNIYEVEANPTIEGASVALGYSAHSKDGNIAIGSYSDATTATDKTKTAYTDKEVETSYVSVGSTKTQRRITNVADGADASDVATVGQLQQAITDTGVNNKANIDATNIGKNLKKTDGKTAAESTDITTNENEWGAAIGNGKVADPNATDAEKNGSKQLVTGGTVYTALQNQKNDLTKDLSVHAGWGINIADEKDENNNVTKKNVISLNRNLGTNYGVTKHGNSRGKVTFDAKGKNSLILGGLAENDVYYSDEGDKNRDLDHHYGTFQDDSVLVGGVNNTTKPITTDSYHNYYKGSVVVGGGNNIASGDYALISGGYSNSASGSGTAILGGLGNEIPDSDTTIFSTIVGGTYNIASGMGATAVGGGDDISSDVPQYRNKASGRYSTTVGGKGNEASGDQSVTVGGIGNKADGSSAIVIGGFTNKAGIANNRSSDEGAIVVGGRYNVSKGGNSVIFGGDSNVVDGTTSV